MKKIIALLLFAVVSAAVFGQSDTIILHPVTTDDYCFTYDTHNGYIIMPGYKSLFETKAVDSLSKSKFKKDVDDRKLTGLNVELNIKYDPTVSSCSRCMIEELLESGNIKILNTSTKMYITKLFVKKVKGKRGMITKEYIDSDSNKKVFEKVLKKPRRKLFGPIHDSFPCC